MVMVEVQVNHTVAFGLWLMPSGMWIPTFRRIYNLHLCSYQGYQCSRETYFITKCIATEHNSLLLISIMLYVSGLLMDHLKALKYISRAQVCMQVEYY